MTGEEIWKPIPGWPAYEVSNLGRVRSYYTYAKRPHGHKRSERVIAGEPQRILKVRSKLRYPYVILRAGRRSRTVQIHRLVLEAFVGPRPVGLMSCHNDGDAFNNHLDNLRYDTPRANVQDTIRMGRQSRKGGPRLFTPEQVRDIRMQRVGGCEFRELASRWHVGAMTIFAICAGRTYKDCPGPVSVNVKHASTIPEPGLL